MHNGKKKNQTQPHRDNEPSGPLCENAIGVGMPGAYVALARQLIPEGVRSATVQDWQQGWGRGAAIPLMKRPCPCSNTSALVGEGKVPRTRFLGQLQIHWGKGSAKAHEYNVQ